LDVRDGGKDVSPGQIGRRFRKYPDTKPVAWAATGRRGGTCGKSETPKIKRERRKTMPQYAILRFSKHKGGAQGRLEAHHERKKEKYASNPDIDTNRSRHNIHLVRPESSYRKEIDSRITAAGCKTRKDSVRFIDTILTATPEFFKGKKRNEMVAYFEQGLEFLSRMVGRKNIFTAVIHLDEKTPHMHTCFTPITKDGRLSAKDIIGNKAKLTAWQDRFHSYMVKAYPHLERGEPAIETKRKHIPMRIFKEAVHLTKQVAKIQEAIESINPINTGKKKDEIGALLQKFFPRMESFETQVRKYKRELDRLTKENTALYKKANEKTGLDDKMEMAKLRGEIKQLQDFYDNLPDEYKRQLMPTRTIEKTSASR